MSWLSPRMSTREDTDVPAGCFSGKEKPWRRMDRTPWRPGPGKRKRLRQGGLEFAVGLVESLFQLVVEASVEAPAGEALRAGLAQIPNGEQVVVLLVAAQLRAGHRDEALGAVAEVAGLAE